MKFYVPDGLLEEVVCTNCHKFLSVFPTYVAREVGKTRCGRCPTPALNDGFVRDEIYETFMEQLLFPCVNHLNGCKEFMKPADTVEHEQYCIYNPICCMVPLCNWNSSKNLLIDHINSNHQEMMLNQSSFELSFSESSKEINFVKYNSQLFQVHWEYNFPANEFKMSVKHIKIDQKTANYKYLYYLKFSAGPNYYKSDKKLTVNEDNWITESVNTLKNCLKNPTVIWVFINIGNLDDFRTDIRDTVTVDWDLLTELECGICKIPYKMPIHICSGGHSLCDSCHQQVNNMCPFCRESMSNIRNYALEQLLNKLMFRCKYDKFGCDYYSKCYDMHDHVTVCTCKNK